MIVLDGRDDRFVDDADPDRLYRVPESLELATSGDGVPALALARTSDGGVLSLELVARWPARVLGEVALPIAEGRFRLLMSTPTARETGEWHAAVPSGAVMVDRGVSLGPAESAIAHSLVEGGEGLVDVELELLVEGRTPTFPWLARIDRVVLRSLVGAALGNDPAPWSEVEDAFAGLTRSVFEWHPLEVGALPPPEDDSLRALARHAAAVILERSADTYSLVSSVPEGPVDFSLSVPREASRWFGLRWSMSEFLARQSDPSTFLLDLRAPEIFEAAVMQVVNDLPLAEGGIPSVSVDVQTDGPTGTLSHTFALGEPSAARLTFVRETGRAQQVQWRPRTTVVGTNGTGVITGDYRPTDLVLRVDREAVGLAPLRFRAERRIFDVVESLEIAIGSLVKVLTRSELETWAVGQTPPATVDVTAVLPDGTRHALGAQPLGADGLTIGAALLAIGDTTTVTLRHPDDPAGLAYLAVEIEGGPLQTLDPGESITWSVRREHRFAAPRLRYKTRHVPQREDGSTEAMVSSDWREGVGDEQEVEL